MSSNDGENSNPGIIATSTLARRLFPPTSIDEDSPPQPTTDEEKLYDDGLLTLLSLDLPKTGN